MIDFDRSISRIVGDYILDGLRFTDRREPYRDDVRIEVGEHEKIRPFFAAALQDRFKWYCLAILVTGVVTLATVGPGVNSIQVSGLLLDLIGAFVLGVGLLRSDVGIERDSMSTTEAAAASWDSHEGDTLADEYRDPLSVSSEARDTVDGLAGICFLMVGFALQLVVVVG
jgi:hypothetical protein